MASGLLQHFKDSKDSNNSVEEIELQEDTSDSDDDDLDMAMFNSLKQYYIMPKFGKNFNDIKLTQKALYHIGIKMVEEL